MTLSVSLSPIQLRKLDLMMPVSKGLVLMSLRKIGSGRNLKGQEQD